ncbi:MAG TPA: hypothetical protein VGR57_00580 [Ktedonobacterales bacterium]|nr:hypothetical protein [Ktedonobacterales bacterium]
MLAVTLAAVLALAGCGASSVSTADAPSIAGTWVGTGTVSAGGPSGPIAYYLDLTTGANHQITGTGQGCTHGPDRLFIAHLTISGASGSAKGDYTMDFKTPDLGPGEHILHVNAHVSGSQMTFSGVDTATTPSTTSMATLMHGSMNDFNTQCNSLPTPVPTT